MTARVRTWARGHPHALALAAALIVVTLPFVEVLLGLRTAIWGDVGSTYIPRYATVWERLRNGESPFWWGTMFSGFNSLGGGQSGIFYPLSVLFHWFDAATAYQIWFFLHLWAMTIGWVLWSRRRWGSSLASFITGVGGALNGYAVYHTVFMPCTAMLALLPWSLLVLDLLLERGQWRLAALLSLILGTMMVVGLPQFLLIVLAAIGIIALVQLLGSAAPLRLWLQVGISFVVGVALGAAQLLPTLMQSRSSQRPKLSKELAFSYALTPRHLVTFLFPGALGGGSGVPGVSSSWQGGAFQHELANYLGITLAALAVIGLFRLRRDRLAIALVLLALVGFVSATGGGTPIGDFIYDFVPLADRFRAWARNALWVNLAVVILAGAGIRELQAHPRRTGKWLMLACVPLALLGLAFPKLPNIGNSLAGGAAGATARIVPPALLAIFGGAVFLTARYRRARFAVVALLCSLDLMGFAAGAPWRSQGLPVAAAQRASAATQPDFGAVADASDGVDRWVSDFGDSTELWSTVLISDVPTANGYDPLVDADYALTVGDMTYFGEMQTGLFWSGGWLPDILRTTTLYLSPYAASPAPSWRYRGNVGDHALWDYTPRLAESYLVGFAQPGTLNDARNGINNPDTPLTEFAYIDTNTINDTTAFAALTAPGPSGTVNSGAMDDGGHGRWSVTADRPSLFVTSYAWMDGWTATVDGKPVPVARTNALVLGVPVPAGTHEVRLAFTPPGWTAGRNISLAALAVVVLMLAGSTPLGRRVLDAGRRRLRRTPVTATS